MDDPVSAPATPEPSESGQRRLPSRFWGMPRPDRPSRRPRHVRRESSFRLMWEKPARSEETASSGECLRTHQPAHLDSRSSYAIIGPNPATETGIRRRAFCRWPVRSGQSARKVASSLMVAPVQYPQWVAGSGGLSDMVVCQSIWTSGFDSQRVGSTGRIMMSRLCAWCSRAQLRRSVGTLTGGTWACSR